MPDPGPRPPAVSVVIPVLNEERHLRAAVGQVLAQAYDGELEVVLAVGPSKDATEQIAAELAAADPRVTVVPNPTGKTPAALNAAIAAASHDIIVRVDGHGELTPGYIATAVGLLERTGAVNVGGVMDAQGETRFEQAVAWLYTSPVGLGASTFHQGGHEGPAETVYLGVFRRDALAAVGGFDERMHRAQDWELNYRLRRAGGQIWFSPALSVTYRPRSDLLAVGKQFFRTGQWRREVVRRYPETASSRYLAPPVAVAGLAAGTTVGALGMSEDRPRWLRLGWLAPVGYASVLSAVAAGATDAAGRPLPVMARLWIPPVAATMHVCWGLGFLTGLPKRRRPT